VRADDSVTWYLTYEPFGQNAFFPLGLIQETATVFDSVGNSASCTFPVRVVDTVPPRIQCPDDVVAVASGPEGIAWVRYQATATDLGSTPRITYLPPDSNAFGVGTTRVTATAWDFSGNKASCMFNVTVRSSPALGPECGCGSAGAGTGGLAGLGLVLALARARRRGRACSSALLVRRRRNRASKP
jgi:hypothetical protein